MSRTVVRSRSAIEEVQSSESSCAPVKVSTKGDIEQSRGGAEADNDASDYDIQCKGSRSGPIAGPKYSTLTMCGIFSVFMLSGPMLIMSNKYILKDLEFSFPLTLTFITLSFCSALCWAYVSFAKVEMKRRETMTASFYLRRICPIGALSAGTVVFGMTSYLFLTVAFIQMLKAFTPVMTMTGLVIFGLENPSRGAILCVLVISLGTAIAGYGELNFSLLGVACMILAQMFEALKLIFTQMVLQRNKFSLVETLYYVTPTSAACVLFFACILEFPHMSQSDLDKVLINFRPFLTSCIVAITTNVVNTFVVQSTNALVLKLSVTARNALLVLFNAVMMGETVTRLEGIGYVVSLGGFLGYNYVKLS